MNEFIKLNINSILNLFKNRSTGIVYTGSAGVNSIAQLVSGIAIIKYVEPSELGIWNSVKILTVYSFFILIGVNNGLNRELPFTLGQNKYDKANTITGVALYYNITTSVLIGSLCIIALLLFYKYVESKLFFALVIIIPYILINHYNNLLIVTYRSNNSFKGLSYIKLVESFLMLITIILVAKYGYNGMLVRSLLLILLVTLFMHMYQPFRVKPQWSKLEFYNLLKTGIPIFALDYIKNISVTFAPLFVLKYGGFESVGLLYLGTMAFSTITVIPASITQYTYPKYCYNYGMNNKSIELWNIGIRSLMLSCVMIILTIVFALITINPVISIYFPKYIGGIIAAKIFIIASLFNSVSVLTSILLALKQFKLLFINQLIFSTLLIIMPIAFIKLIPDPIVGASIGVLLANAGNFIIVMCTVYYATHVIAYA